MTRSDGVEVEHVFELNQGGSGDAAKLEESMSEFLRAHGNLAVSVAAKLVWKSLSSQGIKGAS
jgi:hypothetical protein